MKNQFTYLIISVILFSAQLLSQGYKVLDLNSYNLSPKRTNNFNIVEQFKNFSNSDFPNYQIHSNNNNSLMGNDFLLSERIEQDWESSNWLNKIRDFNTYDENNNMIERLRQLWDGSNWVNHYFRKYIYNEQNKIIEEIEQQWDVSFWVNLGRTAYTYDTNYSMVEKLQQVWDGYDWESFGRRIYTYSSNILIEEIYQNYIMSGWEDFSRYLYTYDIDNNLSEWIYQLSNGPTWGNLERTIYQYDQNNYLTQEVYFVANYTGWEVRAITTYEYDIQYNLTSMEIWGISWSIVETNTYDINNLLIEKEIVYNDSGVIQQFKHLYSYDSNNNLIEDLRQDYDGSNWINYSRCIYNYIPTNVKESNDQIFNQYLLYNNYPNPFNPTTIIKYQIPKHSLVSLTVYDVLGNEVALLLNEEKPQGVYEIKFDAVGLSSGLYFYRLQSADFVETKKMILIK